MKKKEKHTYAYKNVFGIDEILQLENKKYFKNS
jgi:hypothetical protein